jgi:hypothetical protein
MKPALGTPPAPTFAAGAGSAPAKAEEEEDAYTVAASLAWPAASHPAAYQTRRVPPIPAAAVAEDVREAIPILVTSLALLHLRLLPVPLALAQHPAPCPRPCPRPCSRPCYRPCYRPHFQTSLSPHLPLHLRLSLLRLSLLPLSLPPLSLLPLSLLRLSQLPLSPR